MKKKSNNNKFLNAAVTMTFVAILLFSTTINAAQEKTEEKLNFGFVNDSNDYLYNTNSDSAIKNIARWDGNEWHNLGSGRNRTVCTLTNYDGDLIVGGIFDDETQGSCPPMYINDSILRWNGETWSLMTAMGNPLIAFIYSLNVWNGELYAGGFFFGESEIHHLARYEGYGWSEVGGGTYDPDYTAEVLTLSDFNNDLVVGGGFTNVGSIQGPPAAGLALWDNVNWDPIGNPFYDGRRVNRIFTSSCVIGENLYVGGMFKRVGPDIECRNLAVYGPCGPGGTMAWSDEILIGYDDIGNECMILSVEEFNGDLIVGGFFDEINGVSVNHIARWDGNEWLPLGDGMTSDDTENTRVHDLFVYEGDLYAGGYFTSAGSSSAINLAKWDGSEWTEVGNDVVDVPFTTGMWQGVWTIEEYNGDLIVGGNFIDDCTPPESTCTLLGEMHNNVYISDVTVVLEATDDMSGVNHIMYKVDDGEWNEYDISFTITEEGTHTVYYYAVDNDNNTEPEKSTEFIIDFQNDQPELEIEIIKGLGVTIIISNVGEVDAYNVISDVNITGGILNRINTQLESTDDILAAGEEVILSSSLIGLGPINIDVKVSADDFEEITENTDGFIILFYVI